MSLLQNLSYKEYHTALGFSKEKCEVIADLAGLKISFNDTKKPGEVLLKTLDRRGYSAEQYKNFLLAASQVKTIVTYYRPESKVAILIANDRYQHLSKLATPSIDCDSLAANLKNLGFIVVTIKNTHSRELKEILSKVFQDIPEDSYCFIFYAGHGGGLCNLTCLLGIECPTEDIGPDHCITDNFILSESAKCKPELCVLILDVCRLNLDRVSNPKLFASVPDTVDYTTHSNLLLAYSTQSSHAAYEVLQIECSTTIDDNVTYELKTGDSARIVPGSSQYVNALCTRLGDDLDVSSLLDKVHGDVENSIRKQKPLKIQSGVAKRSLYDPVKGDVAAILTKMKEVTEGYENCVVY
ncbi:hypothetical protein ABMA28_010188 [Loxostege sticticalis]|uniref:Caspase family p20 domain-containing protein n=1 Tax=Loxostege sticticalis TaxID=481309 RepID=A0ABD0S9Z9_LOXSC